MEPWQQEVLYRGRRERQPAPRCEACGEAITTEYGYFLDRFGLNGYACDRCMEASRVWAEEIIISEE